MLLEDVISNHRSRMIKSSSPYRDTRKRSSQHVRPERIAPRETLITTRRQPTSSYNSTTHTRNHPPPLVRPYAANLISVAWRSGSQLWVRRPLSCGTQSCSGLVVCNRNEWQLRKRIMRDFAPTTASLSRRMKVPVFDRTENRRMCL